MILALAIVVSLITVGFFGLLCSWIADLWDDWLGASVVFLFGASACVLLAYASIGFWTLGLRL